MTATDGPNHALIENAPMPGHFYVDIGTYCNLRCPFCVTGARSAQAPARMMSLPEFTTIFERIKPYAKLISLYNWGEPLLNRDLVAMIRLAASEGARVHIDTNLSTQDLSDAQCEALVRSGLFSLFASIDGVSQEAYETYRVRGKVARVFGNLERLIATKLRLGSPFPVLGWQFHVHAFNEHEIDAAQQKAIDLGIGIVFKRLNAPDPAWHSSIHDTGFMVLKGGAWFNQTYMPPAMPGFDASLLHPAVQSPCSQLFGTMTISPNGDVMPCTCVEGPAHAMGNLLHSPLEEIWNNAAFAKSRRFILGYGPEQKGGSVCEMLDCPLQQKCIPAPSAVA
jgi:radical SAM protein with 4Fe4S-binding SPASM domain